MIDLCCGIGRRYQRPELAWRMAWREHVRMCLAFFGVEQSFDGMRRHMITDWNVEHLERGSVVHRRDGLHSDWNVFCSSAASIDGCLVSQSEAFAINRSTSRDLRKQYSILCEEISFFVNLADRDKRRRDYKYPSFYRSAYLDCPYIHHCSQMPILPNPRADSFQTSRIILPQSSSTISAALVDYIRLHTSHASG